MPASVCPAPPGPEVRVRSGCYRSIALYIAMMAVSHALIDTLGFYPATFLCVLAMTAYGTLFLSGRKLDVKSAGFVLSYSVLLLALEYGCFTLIMDVQTPSGLW